MSVSSEQSHAAEAQNALVNVTARERQILAQRMHDGLCQNLSGLQFLVQLANAKAQRSSPELAGDLAEIRGILREIGGEVHEIVHLLRAPGHPTSPS